MRYSKSCVKQPLSKRLKIGFQGQLLFNAGQKYCRMLQGEHSAILLAFIKLPFVIKIFVCLFLGGRFTQVLLYMINYSNTPRLYSQWLNSVIYWLINHCTDWARTGVMSFVCQFDFHDIIYPKRHCNVDNRRRNVVFTTVGRSKKTRYRLDKSCGKFKQSVQDGGIFIDYEGFVHIFNLFCVLKSK